MRALDWFSVVYGCQRGVAADATPPAAQHHVVGPGTAQMRPQQDHYSLVESGAVD